MEHMKYVHKDPNASGVPGEFLFFSLAEEFVYIRLMPKRYFPK